jgi:hypothetical protein
MYRAFPTACAVAALLVPVAMAKTDYVITGDTNVGGFPRDGTGRQAIDVFGPPTTKELIGFDTCVQAWRSHGVVMRTHYTLGGQDPCGPLARHTSTTVTDRRWRTSKGLQIGEPLRELRRLYPKARKDAPGKWRLTTRAFAGIPYPGLEATVKNGRVISLTVYGPRSPF